MRGKEIWTSWVRRGGCMEERGIWQMETWVEELLGSPERKKLLLFSGVQKTQVLVRGPHH